MTEKVGDVLEVRGLSVLDSGLLAAGVAVAIKARNGLESGTLSRIARIRRGAIGRAL
jgi:hypothetical protein